MGTVFKKTFTKTLPADAELFSRKGERFAKWKVKGKTRTARLTVPAEGKYQGQDRLLIESPYYFAQYRDGSGIVRVVATGCRDETAARGVLADLERRAELVKANVMTATEDAIAEHQGTPLAEHFGAYVESLKAKGVTRIHQEDTERYLNRLAAECSFSRLADLNRSAVERWLVLQIAEGMSARTRNAYQGAMVAFCNWCLENHRLAVNPFAKMPKANEKADPRRQRRAMEETELTKLLGVARQRPLLDAMTVRRGRRKGEAYARLRDATRERLDWLGRERALTYKTLILTGLRKGELASLTVGQLDLDGPVAYAALDAADEKNREGSCIALRDDLAADLRQWLSDKLQRLQNEARRTGRPIPARLPADMVVFDVPQGLRRILDRDLRLAGIPKRDDRGRTLDVHALRHTFGTLLSKGGVAPRTAQAAMRHSDIGLTMNVYTDPRLLDVRGALDVLPALPLNASGERQTMKATGTDNATGEGGDSLALVLAQTSDNRSKSGSIPVKMADTVKGRGEYRGSVASGESVKGNSRLTSAVSRLSMSGRLDSNQRPPEPHSGDTLTQVVAQNSDTPPADFACTPACTRNQETDHAATLETLAAALLGLSAGDRARLAALLIGEGSGDQAKGKAADGTLGPSPGKKNAATA